jgi:hypothetical protein
MAPVEIAARVPVAELVARSSAVLSKRATLLPVKPTVPPKLLPVLLRLMSVPVNEALLAIVTRPFCVMAPDAETTSVPVAELVPSRVARLLVSEILAPLKITAPVRLLVVLVRLMSNPGAERLVVPATVSDPV